MGKIVGIDLGTTFSVVAIPEERKEDGFFSIRECPGCAVVLDNLKRRTVPSVVAEDQNGNILVGHRAKGRAGFFPEPIMFAKRFMGEEKTFALDKCGELTPEQVSTEILKFLKAMAEERLGEPVEEAVITVPAYFGLNAKQLTERAGEAAGLRVLQTAQEPVAAALMYSAGDARSDLVIMTYDLGGGTFDVAILRKRDDIIDNDSILAFDGDRFLGGYNFDKKLAYWILDRLIEQGYSLPSDEKDAAFGVMFAKLMVYAERAKVDLSQRESYTVQEDVTGITDRDGNEVAINLEISQKDFRAMIQEDLERTVELSLRALSKAGLQPGDLDEIIMVGGSSRIPWVGTMLQDALGKEPRLVEPSLCVALGAAIIAGRQAASIGCFKLDNIPEETCLPSVTITGKVVPGAALASPAGCRVSLRTADGAYNDTREVAEEGGFVFDAVPLEPEETTQFTLVAVAPTGAELTRHQFSVKHNGESAATGAGDIETNILAKPIRIAHVDGLLTVAEERTRLPFDTTLRANTADKSGEIHIPILEENTPLGEIVMKEIPQATPIGTEVQVTLNINKNFHIHGRAYMPSLGREATVLIEIPKRAVKSPEVLRRDFEALNMRAQEVLNSAPPASLVEDGRGMRLNKRLAECREQLNGRAPDAHAIQDRMDEIENLVRQISAGWQPHPPRAVFNQKVAEAQELLAAAKTKDESIAAEGYDNQLAAIQQEADKAFQMQDDGLWKASYRNLVDLCDRLDQRGRRGDGGSGGTQQPPDPAMLKLALARELSQLKQRATDMGRLDEFDADFEQAAQSLAAIDPKASDAMLQISDWYKSVFEVLRDKLGAPKTPIGWLKVTG